MRGAYMELEQMVRRIESTLTMDQIKASSIEHFGRGWCSWFAWRPVHLGAEGWRWLCWLERLRVPFGYYLRIPPIA